MRIYENATNEQEAGVIARSLLMSVQKTTASIPIRDLFNRVYIGGTGVALIVMAIHELTAINAILLYSN